MSQTPTRAQVDRWTTHRVTRRLASLRNTFYENRIWRPGNEPRNQSNPILLQRYEQVVNEMQEHHIPLRLLWQEDGIFDRVASSTRRAISGSIAHRMLCSVQQMTRLMQEFPDQVWIWPPDMTTYSERHPFVGAPGEAATGLEIARGPRPDARAVLWDDFGLSPEHPDNNIQVDNRSRPGSGRQGRRSASPPSPPALSPPPRAAYRDRSPARRGAPASPDRDIDEILADIGQPGQPALIDLTRDDEEDDNDDPPPPYTLIDPLARGSTTEAPMHMETAHEIRQRL